MKRKIDQKILNQEPTSKEDARYNEALSANTLLQNTELKQLLKHPHIWRAKDHFLLGKSPHIAPSEHSASIYPTGINSLDRMLLNGGWPKESAVEILTPKVGIGELQLLLPLLMKTSQEAIHREQFIAIISPPYAFCAVALQQAGLNLSSLLIIDPSCHKEQLWAIQQCQQSPACNLLLCWPTQPYQYTRLRKLQLSARSGRTLSFLFRPLQTAEQASPVPIRVTVETHNTGYRTLVLNIIKQPGRWCSQPFQITFDATPQKSEDTKNAIPINIRAS